MWKKLVLFFFISIFQKAEAQQILPEFLKSDDIPIEISEDQDFEFGYLKVPENWEKESSEMIELPIFIFKSRSNQPKKDPIIYLVGGPGSSIVRNAPYMNYYRYLDDRDFILFEQRGNAFAKPHLACAEWSEAINKGSFPGTTEDESLELRITAAEDCRSRLTKSGVDLDGYNTLATSKDINALVNILGIKQYNILSLSYGTKVAQTLMRDYPDKIRSIVMDSALPLEVDYDAESIQNLYESYQKIFFDCRNQDKCRTSYPNLEERFFNFLRKHSTIPLEVLVYNPKIGRKESKKVFGKDVFYLLATVGTANTNSVPMLIDSILDGNYDLIVNQIESQMNSTGSGDGIGTRLSVWCSEELPFANSEDIRTNFKGISGLSSTVFDLEVCNSWDVKVVDKKENEPIKSDIPVLLINGKYDNETPVKWAKSMLPNLSKGYQIVFEGWMHTPTTYWSNPCAMNLANAFFNDPTQKPNLECFENIKTPEFVIPRIE